ncbi:hypothetical protein BDAP_000121 [Binucleata daphniae]
MNLCIIKGIDPKTEAYIQSLVLRKTLESLSFERRRGLEEETLQMDAIEISEKLINKQAEEVTVVTEQLW